jgi:hypothetical protein
VNVRASGKTADEEALDEIRKDVDKPAETELPEERERRFRFPGFSRMRTDWYGEDAMTMTRVHTTVDNVINDQFKDLLAIRQELYDLVRQPEMFQGAPRRDVYGWIVWARDEDGNYQEDWSRLGHKEQERFLFLITTRLFEWKEREDRLWAESMMAKTQWEEAFSTGWQATEGARPTEGDKTANGRLTSQEERYFAIFQTYLSRRGESLVEGMKMLAQRIKDVHTA